MYKEWKLMEVQRMEVNGSYCREKEKSWGRVGGWGGGGGWLNEDANEEGEGYRENSKKKNFFFLFFFFGGGGGGGVRLDVK